MRTKFIVMAAIVLIGVGTVFSQASSQGKVALKDTKFGSIAKDDPIYKNALDAHDLTGTLKLVGKDGAFRGVISQVFEQRGGYLAILDFDPNYKTAVTAILKKENFAKFPAVDALSGKEVVVTGKFVEYNGKAQIELTDPKQILVVK